MNRQREAQLARERAEWLSNQGRFYDAAIAYQWAGGALMETLRDTPSLVDRVSLRSLVETMYRCACVQLERLADELARESGAELSAVREARGERHLTLVKGGTQ